MRRIVAFSLCLLLAGCVTTKLVPGADSIRVTSNGETVKGCKFIGEIKASDRMNGGFGQGAAEENTDRRLKNQALEMGGNVILLNRSNTSYYGSSARGELYSCSM